MESDGFVRSESIDPENIFDGGSTTPAAWSQQSVAPKAEFNSVLSGLKNLLANSGARIVTNGDHRVVWATSEAAVLAARNSCINFANGELTGRTCHAEALLRDIFADAERVAPSAIESLMSSEPSSNPELFVRAQVYPAAGVGFTVFTIRNLAADLQNIPDLRRLYGLTRAEQKIIGLMMQGKSVRDVAHESNKSILTIRSHLKRAYSKLNVSSKEQLFSTVLKLMVN